MTGMVLTPIRRLKFGPKRNDVLLGEVVNEHFDISSRHRAKQVGIGVTRCELLADYASKEDILTNSQKENFVLRNGVRLK